MMQRVGMTKHSEHYQNDGEDRTWWQGWTWGNIWHKWKRMEIMKRENDERNETVKRMKNTATMPMNRLQRNPCSMACGHVPGSKLLHSGISLDRRLIRYPAKIGLKQYEPTLVTTSMIELPAVSEYSCARQGMQDSFPVLIWYLPGMQRVHVAEAGDAWLYPAGQPRHFEVSPSAAR